MSKNNLITLFLLFLISVVSCKNNFCLNGVVPREYDGQIISLIRYNADNEIVIVDSTVILDGKFQFEGNEYIDGASMVQFEDGSGMYLILESGMITLNCRDQFFVGGTKQNDLWQMFIDSIWNIELVNALIIENQTKIVSKIIFENHIYTFPSSELETLCSKLSTDFKSHPIIISAIEKNKKYNNIISKRKSLIGTIIQDVSLLNMNHENEQLLQHIGKSEYIYLDFWSSWCGPCIAELPGLKKLCEKYKESDIQIIGISIDDNRNDWLEAVNKHNISEWMQLLLPKETQSQAKEIFSFTLIPYGMLLDRKGEIISAGIRVSDLEIFLENNLE